MHSGSAERTPYRPAAAAGTRAARGLHWVVFVLCAGCASVSEMPAEPAATGLEIAGVEIRNELAYPVTDVRVLLPESGDFVSCGTVFPDTTCATAFPLLEYHGDPLSVTWQERGQPQAMKPFRLRVPPGMDATRPLWVQVVIFAPGSGGARLLTERSSPR